MIATLNTRFPDNSPTDSSPMDSSATDRSTTDIYDRHYPNHAFLERRRSPRQFPELSSLESEISLIDHFPDRENRVKFIHLDTFQSLTFLISVYCKINEFRKSKEFEFLLL